jgi:mannose-6-phosphate isomerase-like protein (cupin superfamily)
MPELVPLELGLNFIHLSEGPAVVPLPVGADFWQNVAFLPAGRLVSLITTAENWRGWEVHWHGDEVVLQMTGAMELVLEWPEGPSSVVLRPGMFYIVPAGTWHTANVVEPGAALFITLGHGTEGRPR